jgi:hypothetical protein
MARALRSRRFLLLVGALLLACNSDQMAGPDGAAVPVEPEHAGFFASDPCLVYASYACHGQPIVWWYYSNATVPYGDPEFDCPVGCTTYPLGYGTREQVRDFLANHIQSDSACAWVKPWLQTSYNYGRIRWYESFNGKWGDSHFTSSSATTTDIHVWHGAFVRMEDLGETLIHEAAHVHFLEGDETFAENWAVQCYKP